MGQVLEFPSETVRTWLGVEREFRRHLSLNGVEPDCQDYAMQQIRPVYDAYCGEGFHVDVRRDDALKFIACVDGAVFAKFQDSIAGLLWEVVMLEVKLWRLGVHDGGPTKGAA